MGRSQWRMQALIPSYPIELPSNYITNSMLRLHRLPPSGCLRASDSKAISFRDSCRKSCFELTLCSSIWRCVEPNGHLFGVLGVVDFARPSYYVLNKDVSSDDMSPAGPRQNIAGCGSISWSPGAQWSGQLSLVIIIFVYYYVHHSAYLGLLLN